MDDALSNAKVYSVSDIAGAVKKTLESDFAHVRVRGEVSKATYHGNGHVYLTIKDVNASIDVVIWKGSLGRVRHQPQVGDDVVLTGKVSTNPARSQYQLIASECELAGLGALLAQLERLKAKLAAEGLFDANRKQLLPTLPRVIGVITSPTGAVIRDILHRIRDRYPCHVIVWPVLVQGDGAAGQVTAAIRGFNALPAGGAVPRPDVLIVARGGGSVEDLWPFNDEGVVRAAAASGIPLISAIGHETDTTLIDYAADVRAPTPTGAAELATPVRSDIEASLADRQARLHRALQQRLQGARSGLVSAARALPRPDDLLGVAAQRLAAARLSGQVLRQGLAQRQQRLDGAGVRLAQALRRPLDLARQRVAGSSQRLTPRVLHLPLAQLHQRVTAATARLHRAQHTQLAQAQGQWRASAQMLEVLSYKSTLARGFAVIRGPKGVIARADQLRPGSLIEIELADGSTAARIEGQQGRLL